LDLKFETVLDSASGLQGYQPLVYWNNVSKGSRQIGFVPSVKGLALGVEQVGHRSDNVKGDSTS